MKLFWNLFFLTSLLIFISSCGTVKKAFTNQKKNSSDEFLIEKKSPLTMPPSYGELPLPEDENQKNTKKNEKIKNLIGEGSGTEIEDNKAGQNLEEKLLKKINKD